MNLERKIERQYNKWVALSEVSVRRKDEKKMDAAYRNLEKMFPTPEAFKAFWQTKIDGALKLINKH